MKRTYITLIILLLLGVGFSPFFLSKNLNNSVTVCTNIISALANLITLFIALILYSKYGVEKTLINKQSDVVLNLLLQLKKTSFLIEGTNGGLVLCLDMIHHRFYDAFEKEKLLFTIGYIEKLNNIWEIAENIFLPVDVEKKFRPLLVHSYRIVENTDNYMIVSTRGDINKDVEFIGHLNGKDINLEEYIELWQSLIDESKKWLKTHSSDKVDINFNRF